MENKKNTTDQDGIRDTEMGSKDPLEGKGRDDGRLPVEKEIEKKNKKENKKGKNSNNNIFSGMGM